MSLHLTTYILDNLFRYYKHLFSQFINILFFSINV